MKKKLAVIIALLLVIAIVIGITVSNLKFRGDLTEISSEKQLQKIVDGYNYSGGSTVLATFICPLIALPTRSFSGGIIEDASSSQSSGAVSYTHLDVYKRQLLEKKDMKMQQN